MSNLQVSSKYTVKQVFTMQQERELVDYVIKCANFHYGLTLVQLRRLAYEFAVKLNAKYPVSWDSMKTAGKDWAASFRKRHPNMSLRKAENTSAARSFGFTKTAVSGFYSLLRSCYDKYNFPPNRIFNLDESGITTVLNGPKVLAQKSQKQVGQFVSRERGELVTFVGIVNATGTALPPVYVFPRVRFKDEFLKNAPLGSIGLANKSGWMTADLFPEVLKHIKHHTNCSLDNPILLLFDNHDSHCSIESIEFARENGILCLSFPPHTSHRLQPLDVSVYGPFKGKLKIAFNDWHVSNVGKQIVIHIETSHITFCILFNTKM
uniref:CSON010990 protein n=1 Tax=Culicoides sonorensis TaxID=179676 RepID=A0A336M6K4_CULSO